MGSLADSYDGAPAGHDGRTDGRTGSHTTRTRVSPEAAFYLRARIALIVHQRLPVATLIVPFAVVIGVSVGG